MSVNYYHLISITFWYTKTRPKSNGIYSFPKRDAYQKVATLDMPFLIYKLC